MSSPGVAALLGEYVSKYNELVDNSSYFRKGIFNHTNASNVGDALSKNGFFKAKHSISLSDRSSQRTQVDTQKDFDAVIAAEKARILSDPELSKRFNDIDRAITKNEGLRSFRSYLERNPKLLPELVDIDALRDKVWTSYLASDRDLYAAFLKAFRTGKTEIAQIVTTAKSQATMWHRVVEIFNARFSVPFALEVANQDDVILSDQAPSLVFKYKDGADECEIGRDQLLNVLSTGEKRALYLLNVIFELEARAKALDPSLLIFDDVVDSFDYRNKYAIVEYLKDNMDRSKFYFIILTHNFDFFRTVQQRLAIPRNDQNCLMTVKTDTQISLVKAQYLHPFDYWKSNLHLNKKMLVATIPMVRNLIEYTQGPASPDFVKLTSLLHKKPDSDSVTIAELVDLINRTLGLTIALEGGTVMHLILQEAEDCLNAPECINLENKVVLSIAIRLLAEEFMIGRIGDPSKTNTVGDNQTAELYRICKAMFPGDTQALSILGQVVLMTPEAIHLNSFMYEPLIDMSDCRLKELYRAIKTLPTKAQP